MISICFICHGNICRSISAEYIFKKMLHDHHLVDKFYVFSRGVSSEEEGNDIYPPMKKVLIKHDVPISRSYARKITIKEMEETDYLIVMDSSNKYLLSRISPLYQEKTFLLKHFNHDESDIEDPWYSGRYELVYQEIDNSLKALLDYLLELGV